MKESVPKMSGRIYKGERYSFTRYEKRLGKGGNGAVYDVKLEKNEVIAYGHFPRPSGPRSPARQGHIKRPVLRLAEPSFLRPANQCC